MITLKERFIVDENGQRVGVLLDIEDYRQLLEDVEELEAIRAYDAAKASGDEAVPLELGCLKTPFLGQIFCPVFELADIAYRACFYWS